MSEKDQIIKEKLDHSGIFNFADVYGYMHNWLKDNGYGVNEEKYSEKISLKGERDISFEWKATRAMSDYFKIELGIKADVSGLSDVEVEIDSQKKKMNKGKIALELKGTMIKDPKNNWDESKPFLKFLREMYDKYIIPDRVDAVEGKIEGDVRALKDEIKVFLELTGKR